MFFVYYHTVKSILSPYTRVVRSVMLLGNAQQVRMTNHHPRRRPASSCSTTSAWLAILHFSVHLTCNCISLWSPICLFGGPLKICSSQWHCSKFCTALEGIICLHQQHGISLNWFGSDFWKFDRIISESYVVTSTVQMGFHYTKCELIL